MTVCPFVPALVSSRMLRNVLQPAGGLINEVFALTITVQAARDHEFLIFRELVRKTGQGIHRDLIQPADDERYFGQTERLPHFGPIEDHIFHLLATQSLRALFTEYPKNRIDNITFPAPVWPHDGSDAIGKLNPGFRKRFKSRHFKGF